MTSTMASTCRNPRQSGRNTRLYARTFVRLCGPWYLSVKQELSAKERQYLARERGRSRVLKALRPGSCNEPSLVQRDPASREFSSHRLVWHFPCPLQRCTEKVEAQNESRKEIQLNVGGCAGGIWNCSGSLRTFRSLSCEAQLQGCGCPFGPGQRAEIEAKEPVG